MVNYCRKVQHIFLEIVLGLDIKICTIVDLKWSINNQRVDKEICKVYCKFLAYFSSVRLLPDMSQKKSRYNEAFPSSKTF